MGKLNSSTDANQHLNLVRETLRTEYNQLGTPFDRASLTAGVVAASEPPLRTEHFSANDRLALLNVAFAQASRESNSSNPVTLERVEETFNRLVSIVKAK